MLRRGRCGRPRRRPAGACRAPAGRTRRRSGGPPSDVRDGDRLEALGQDHRVVHAEAGERVGGRLRDDHDAAAAVGADPLRLEDVATEHGDGQRRVEVPALLGGLVEEGDDRGVLDPLVRLEGHGVDHVDDDVVLADAVLAVPAAGGAVDGEASAAADDAVAVDRLLVRAARNGGGEEGDLVAGVDPAAGDLLGVDLGAAGGGVGEVAPGEDEDAHGCSLGRGVQGSVGGRSGGEAEVVGRASSRGRRRGWSGRCRCSGGGPGRTARPSGCGGWSSC